MTVYVPGRTLLIGTSRVKVGTGVTSRLGQAEPVSTCRWELEGQRVHGHGMKNACGITPIKYTTRLLGNMGRSLNNRILSANLQTFSPPSLLCRRGRHANPISSVPPLPPAGRSTAMRHCWGEPIQPRGEAQGAGYSLSCWVLTR